MNDPRYDGDLVIAGPSAESRARFITRTYGHLLGAIFSFVALEVFLFQSGLARTILQGVISVGWLPFLGGFLIVQAQQPRSEAALGNHRIRGPQRCVIEMQEGRAIVSLTLGLSAGTGDAHKLELVLGIGEVGRQKIVGS